MELGKGKRKIRSIQLDALQQRRVCSQPAFPCLLSSSTPSRHLQSTKNQQWPRSRALQRLGRPFQLCLASEPPSSFQPYFWQRRRRASSTEFSLFQHRCKWFRVNTIWLLRSCAGPAEISSNIVILRHLAETARSDLSSMWQDHDWSVCPSARQRLPSRLLPMQRLRQSRRRQVFPSYRRHGRLLGHRPSLSSLRDRLLSTSRPHLCKVQRCAKRQLHHGAWQEVSRRAFHLLGLPNRLWSSG